MQRQFSALPQSPMRHIRAKSIYPGRVRGVIAEYRRERFIAPERTAESPRSEYRYFKNALRASQLQLASEKKMMLDRRKKNPSEIQAIDDAIDVLESHLMTLEDPYFLAEIKKHIFHTGATAAAALAAVINVVSRQFRFEHAGTSFNKRPEGRHFLQDMSDMKRRILFFLGMQQDIKLPDGVSIVAAQKLTVSEVLALKRAGVRGIVIGDTSETAHELVMLRAMRIPCVAVADARFFRIRKQIPVLLDADIGYIVLKPRKSIRFVQTPEADEHPPWSQKVRIDASTVVELSGTLHFLSEIAEAAPKKEVRQKIGLYRTEYQISEAHEMPTLKQLARQYEYILSLRPKLDVVFRLFDFSDDKNFLRSARIDSHHELRGIRFLLHEKKILETQIVSLLKAAEEAERKLDILIPYVSEAYEIDFVRDIIADNNRSKNKVSVRLGAMLENTAAVLAARQWAEQLDFFYIGTSDLLSSLAMERRDATSNLHRALLSDAFVALAQHLKSIEKSAPLTICGEVVGEPWAVAWLRSFGFRRFVLPTHRMPIITNTLLALKDYGEHNFLKQILKVRDARERVEKAKATTLDILYRGS